MDSETSVEGASRGSIDTAMRLLRFARRHSRMALLQLALAIAGTALILVFPGVVQWFIDDIIPKGRRDMVWTAGGVALAAFFAREVLSFFRTLVNSEFEQRMTHDLRSSLHRKIQHLPLTWFDRHATGDVLTRMADDVPATQRVILEAIDQGATAAFQILIVAIVMFFSNAQLAAIVMLPTPLIAAGGWMYARWISPRAVRARAAASGLNALLHDTVSGIRQIKSYTHESEQQQEFAAGSNRLRAMQNRLMVAWAVYAPAMTFLGNAGLVLLLTAGSLWCLGGHMTAGALMKFLLLVGFLYEPIARLHGVNQTLQNGLASAKRVFEILDYEREEDLHAGERIDPAAVRGDIEFRGVGFSYEGRASAVDGVDLSVRPKQTAAIVGATGAGKSTLFQLLTRFYDPDRGQILLDGKPITVFSKASLRDAIAYVTQDTFLFARTVRDNLLPGKPDATEQELWDALRMACAEDFVRALPKGLDETVGERGGRLSGGERQRIAMARALLKKAPILLLDEATSSVDARSEKFIQQAIEALKKDRTCLIIAHRLSTVIGADVIYVMRDGRIVASGTHAELLRESPYYSDLSQLSLRTIRTTP